MDAESLINSATLGVLLLTVSSVLTGNGVRWGGLGLAAVVAGLIWESVDGWMPPELKSTIMKSLMTVMGMATFVVLTNRRATDIQVTAVAVLGAVGLVGAILASDLGEYRAEAILCAAVLAVVAAGACSHHVFVRSSFSQQLPEVRVRADMLWGMGRTWAIVLVSGIVGLTSQPMATWSVVLVQVMTTAAAIATLLLGEVILLMWRYPGFAVAYTIPASSTRVSIRLQLIGSVVLLPLVVAVPGILRILHATFEWITLMNYTGGLLIIHRLILGLSSIQKEAIRHHKRVVIGSTNAEVRELATENPVYRLLPGLSRKQR